MRIANLIMVHKNPAQLERLLKRLEHPKFDTYVHVDRKVNIDDFIHLKDLKGVFFIENRQICNWGGYSFVQSITTSIKEILESGKNYGFISLLSSQDYPLKSNEFIYRFLNAHQGESFITFEKPNNARWWKHATTRYELYHFTDFNIRGRYQAQRLLNMIMPKRKFPLPYKLYGSTDSSWWTLSIDCAQYVVDFLDNNQKLTRFMRYTWGADEFLYMTIIMNSSFKYRIFNNNMRLIQWVEGNSNPNILRLSDLELLSNSNHFYARKFDLDVDSKILDELDILVDYSHKKQI